MVLERFWNYHVIPAARVTFSVASKMDSAFSLTLRGAESCVTPSRQTSTNLSDCAANSHHWIPRCPYAYVCV